MWLFLPDAFFSIVQPDDDPRMLIVRARFKGDIHKYFRGVKVQTTPLADYRYRARVRRTLVEMVVADAVASINYPNFKAAVDHDDRIRSEAYNEVWAAMYGAQGPAQ